jgi:hypothetical protein
MRKQIQVGSTVIARLYDGREVEAKITAIVDSVAGRKVHIAYGLIALKITRSRSSARFDDRRHILRMQTGIETCGIVIHGK